ncbi:Trypomastigote, Alanine, Serine and Valine rich protein (TASV), subfamily C [Trypanosoma cruzi]|uniref:Trypomastigote, Alanine, Serine and Valine rich protein (TASV), subfamily C n=2 Tax=Trypanosoma cruzi TaxID=5693 RepID=A0A2V2X2K9_TRYCR|nr:Trypomastigote, Alanine, Serine and Valine rich protein (TASV), subfamily C [Trypanosoma cruzi]PWV15029.1 Trypomastigote, Alanine, Serine and Valine rich protein (TASV), subfamily C [Trypanosoma cruzi]
MMMMVTVRRRVVCDLLILALLCCCCCLSVCGTDVPAKSFVIVHFSCPGTDGKLSWRLQGEEEWKKCPKKPEEVDQDSDERARLCVAGGDFYEYGGVKRTRRLFCLPPSDQVEFLFAIKFATYGDLRNSSSAMAQNNDREATDGAQRLQSQPQTGTAAPAATAAASTKAVVDQAQSGVGSPSREAAEAPQKKSPDHTAEDGSAPSSSENITVKEESPKQTAEDGSAQRPSENIAASPLTSTDAKEHVTSAPEASGRPSSSPSGDGAANETSHSSNEGDSESDASGEGNSTVAGTNPLRPTRDESANESTEDIAALLQNFVVLDGSDVTTVWVRTPLLLLVIALVCAAVR